MKSILVCLWGVVALFCAHCVCAQEFYDITAKNSCEQEEDEVDVEYMLLPEVTPYYFQHQFLSPLATVHTDTTAMGLAYPAVYTKFYAKRSGFRSPFDADDIEVTAFNYEGKKIFIWKFPEPQYLREALYMAFFPKDGNYIAYAICIGANVDWEISTSTPKYRQTFGRVKRPESAEECMELLIARGALTGKITPGEFVQEGYQGPEYRPTK